MRNIAKKLTPHQWIVVGLAILTAQFVTLAGWQAWNDSLTFDEPFYITAGYTGLVEQDLRMNFEHPPLPKLAAALPAAVFGDVGIPSVTAWHRGDSWSFSQLVMAVNSRNLRGFVFLFRIVPILQAAAVGFLMYLIGKRLFGENAGFVSAALWLTSPLAVGFGHLNALDIPGALVILLLGLLTLRYQDNNSWARTLTLGAAAGIALLTRSGIGMIAVVAATTIVAFSHLHRSQWARLLRAAVIPVTGWAMVWLVYWLLDPPAVGTAAAPILNALELEVDSWWANLVLLPPWPQSFEAGIRFLADFHQQEAIPGYLFGAPVPEVGFGFWAGSFLLKMTPIAVASIVGGLYMWRHLDRSQILRASFILGLPLIGWAIMMSQATRPFGVRYLIPGVVLLLIAAGPLAKGLTSQIGRPVLILFAILQVFFLWQSHPHSLSWTAPGFGPGWQEAADANVDWGQDLYRLEAWAKDKSDPYVSYFGLGPTDILSEIPNAYSAHPNGIFGGPSRNAPGGTEWVAISASNLNVFSSGPTGILRDYCAVDLIGGTILVYRFETSVPALTSKSGEPRRPADPCFGAEYSTIGDG